jgi:hypothetical protein
MAMLYGDFVLKITGTVRRSRTTTRYKAIVKKGPKPVGHEVMVKFENCGQDPDDFIGREGNFDGEQNDIRDREDRIVGKRRYGTFHNPFVKTVNE